MRKTLDYYPKEILENKPWLKFKWNYIVGSATFFTLLPVVLLFSEIFSFRESTKYSGFILISLAVVMIVSLYISKWTKKLWIPLVVHCFIPQIILISGLFLEETVISAPLLVLLFFPVASAFMLGVVGGFCSALLNIFAVSLLYYLNGSWSSVGIELLWSSSFRNVLAIAVVSGFTLYFVYLFEKSHKDFNQMLLNEKNEKKNLNDRLNLALDATSSVVWEWDLVEGNIKIGNNWQKLFNKPNENSSFKDFFRLLHKNDRRVLYDEIQKYLEGETPRFKHRCEVAVDSVHRYIKIEGACLRGSDSKPTKVVGWIKDRTHESQLMEELKSKEMLAVQSSKMASLGEMASGIAHEINNPLAIIASNADQLQVLSVLKKLDSEKFNKSASVILDMTTRISSIVRGLRTFARDGSDDPFEKFSSLSIATQSIDLCLEKFKSQGIELKVDIQDFDLKCRSVHITQILINLLSNSVHAVQNDLKPWVGLKVYSDGEKACFQVQDSGLGIKKEILNKLFMPFFTSKAVGEGTGLGLSISKGLAKAHGGELSYKLLNSHTCFQLIIPLNIENSARKVS